ncbi:hypothetical protein [Thiorhodovibrio frisius]|uniref:Uncharacterized protein n=1 Tax=Thiorhodovibrio frisius TaxID=631362 RepID=H8Z5H0_9GAMM|nr:hypothetical protein [Thiorhodovibrio frisius]EIC19516.1 hypothetical protein Thi970DRAFT_03095 [Thiorhodovibrio frisius]WPL20521.1 hypothetical protein Thiofri_00619 [Thiorhodovibrio frisius]
MMTDQHKDTGEQSESTPHESTDAEAGNGPRGDRRRAADEQSQDVRANAFAVDRLSQAFETSARRWELIVYPSLFAFIILAAYGFYLVFSLAKDVHYLAISVDSNMTVLASNMQSISDNMVQMSNDMRGITGSVNAMEIHARSLEPMLSNMQSMNESIRSMTVTTAVMRDDLGGMNRSIGRPMNFMNGMMPW